MKKLLMLVLVMLLFSICLSADEEKEENPLHIFNQDPTMENFQKGFNYYKAELEKDENNSGALLGLSYLYVIALNNNLDKIENLEDLKPGEKFQFANLLLALKDYERAVSIYNELNESAPKWSCPWRHKGEALWKMGSLEESEKALLKAIETRETHYDAYTMLADVQKDMGKYEEALKTLEKGFTYYGKDIEDPAEEVDETEVQFLYLELLKRNGREEDFEKVMKKLKEKVPEDERWQTMECLK